MYFRDHKDEDQLKGKPWLGTTD